MRPFVHQARAHGQHPEKFAAYAEGQSPQALFITCSDSRVVPALITGAGPGQLFELRTAGNIVPPYAPERPAGEVATIEYAVAVLGVAHVVVCGHSHCGAVGALVRGDDLGAVPAVREWLRHATARPSGEAGDPSLAAPVQDHVLTQVRRLRSYPCVAARLDAGELELHAWYYEVHTGAVLAHRPDSGAFEAL
ncbi:MULTISPECIES: carbonic anhydrase [Streptomyces]|uniref:carbonic anhydrase n=1 Tax=Streptomyces TaxID=1883 RepID=UPI0022489F3D|nr:carbonic anhydrase [Streptomyces sp. JHD 1]MCX2968557.1 carbonic anhydrase [Streptomyces sp. JHD 1]